jgi:hypothetical protein
MAASVKDVRRQNVKHVPALDTLAFGDRGYRFHASGDFNSSPGYIYDAGQVAQVRGVKSNFSHKNLGAPGLAFETWDPRTHPGLHPNELIPAGTREPQPSTFPPLRAISPNPPYCFGEIVPGRLSPMPNPPFAAPTRREIATPTRGTGHRLNRKAILLPLFQQFTMWYKNGPQTPKTARKSLRLKCVQITRLLSNACSECVAVTY